MADALWSAWCACMLAMRHAQSAECVSPAPASLLWLEDLAELCLERRISYLNRRWEDLCTLNRGCSWRTCTGRRAQPSLTAPEPLATCGPFHPSRQSGTPPAAEREREAPARPHQAAATNPDHPPRPKNKAGRLDQSAAQHSAAQRSAGQRPCSPAAPGSLPGPAPPRLPCISRPAPPPPATQGAQLWPSPRCQKTQRARLWPMAVALPGEARHRAVSGLQPGGFMPAPALHPRTITPHSLAPSARASSLHLIPCLTPSASKAPARPAAHSPCGTKP